MLLRVDSLPACRCISDEKLQKGIEWCSIFQDIHATSKGYGVIAATFESGSGY